MLTPRADDPNRQAELKRKKDDPSSFGAAHEAKNSEAVASKKASTK